MPTVGKFWTEDEEFIGEFTKEGLFAIGMLRITDGPTFTGQLNLQGNVHEGAEGIMTYPNGDSYQGEYGGEMKGHLGQKHGSGQFKMKAGHVYMGEFKNDQMHGKGHITFKTGSSIFGIFENGELAKPIDSMARPAEDDVEEPDEAEIEDNDDASEEDEDRE